MLEEKLRINSIARKLGVIDTAAFVLANPLKLGQDELREVVNEYQFLQKLQAKIPEWESKANILGTSLKAIEQCSTPITAAYKFKDLKVNNAIDLTGGYGIDSFYLSQHCEKLVYNELNSELSQIVAHNFVEMGIQNISISNLAAEQFVNNNSNKFDLVYLDPDRRGSEKQKLVLIEDCLPNLIELQDKIHSIADLLIVKYSPMLDITLALKSLDYVFKVVIIAVKNDVKELVFYSSKTKATSKVRLETVNFTPNGTQFFGSSLGDGDNSAIQYEAPLSYLYEPNAAIMKAGLWSEIAEKFSIAKLAINSHFYTSEQLIKDFPGRIFKVQWSEKYSKKLQKQLVASKANIISRNFGVKADQLRQKLKINEGNEEFLIFTSDFCGVKTVIKAEKLNQ